MKKAMQMHRFFRTRGRSLGIGGCREHKMAMGRHTLLEDAAVSLYLRVDISVFL
jgi:hypothetical protein